MGGRIKRNRARLELDLRDSWKRSYFSPAVLSLSKALIPRLRAVANGRLLDVGSGTMPFRTQIEGSVREYRSLDIERRVPEVDFVADVHDMTPVSSDDYDVVLCSEVLEHVKEPARALEEIERVLRPGGRLVLTVPFLSRLHEEPNDFYRFTRYGLASLLQGAGFDVQEIVPTGSVLSFVGHQVSTVVVCGTWDVPLLRDLAFWSNLVAVVLPCYWLDRLFGGGGKAPLNYVVVATKPDPSSPRPRATR